MPDTQDSYELGEMVALGRRLARHATGDDPGRILAHLLVQVAEIYECYEADRVDRCAIITAITAGSLVHLIESLAVRDPSLIHTARSRLDSLLADEHR